MIDTVMRSSSLLSPCMFKDNQRTQQFINSDQQSYAPGGTMQFSLPLNTNLDMTDSFINFECSIDATGRVDEVGEIYSLKVVAIPAVITNTVGPVADDTGLGAPTAGSLNFLFDGEVSSAIPYNATAAQVLAALQGMKRLIGRGYKVAVSGVDIFPNASNVLIYINNFDVYGQRPQDVAGGLMVINTANIYTQNPVGRFTTHAVEFSRTQDGALSMPRLERFQLFHDYVYIQINNETIYNLVDANILEAILVQVDNEYSSQEYILDGAGRERGTGFDMVTVVSAAPAAPTITHNWVSRQLKVGLQNIDLFRHILPLKILSNAQLRIYMHLDSSSRVLICSTATNSTNQAYTLRIPKLHYHGLIFSPSEEEKLIELKNSASGLVIPFRGWSNFKRNLPAGTSSENIIFNPSQSNFLGIYFVMLSTDYAGDARNIRKITTFLKNNIGSYRLKIGDFYMPRDAIRSNVSQVSNSEIISELKNFTELVTYQRIDGDMFLFNPFWLGDVTAQGVNPTVKGWIPWQTEERNQSTIFAIGTADIGYNDNSGICNYVSLLGVDAKSLANVQLELVDMSLTNNCLIEIFYLHQDFLIFQGDQFQWKH